MIMRFSSLLSATTLALIAATGFSLGQETKTDKQTDAKVQNIFETLYAENCRSLMPGNTPSRPTIYNFTFNYGDENYPPRPYRLYEFLCFEGPYNQSFVYFGADDYQEVTHLTFAVPTFEVSYENDDSNGPVKDIKVTGFSTIDQVVNAEFDELGKTTYSFAKWRGAGDAFTSGTWKFESGKFVLHTYEVDASYDGEHNPITIYQSNSQ